MIITNPQAVWLLLGSFFVLILLRTPIAFSIGFSSLITTIYLGLPVGMVVQNMVKGINVFALMAVPFFILAGEIMGSGGISDRLISLSNACVGWMRGGLAMVNIVASMFFGGISGSSAADTSSIGAIMIPMMRKQGYDAEFATNVTMASSVQGMLIPPSHNMVIYSLAAGGVSVGALFMAGMMPGILLGVALMIFSYVMSIIRKYPVGDPFSFRQLLKTLRSSILGLGTVLIVVVGVISGIFTATESAAIAVAYSFILTFFIYREIPLKAFGPILGRSLKTLSIVMILIGTSSAFGYLLAYLKVPALIAKVIFSISTSKFVVLMIMNIFMLFLGMIMDMSSIILIATPILLPIAMQVGVSPIHFGAVMILNLGIGVITPPVGSTLFIGSAISGVKIERLSVTLLPFYAVMFAVLMLITYVPAFVMWVPKLLGY